MVVSVIGGLVALLTVWGQARANRNLERTKYESELILKALEPTSDAARIERLRFLVRTGLIRKATIDLPSLDTTPPPQFYPGTQLLLPSTKDIQEGLKGLQRYSGPVDGKVSDSLRSAIARYQKDRGLIVDSSIGPALYGHIQADLQIQRAVEARSRR